MGDWISRALANIETQTATSDGVDAIRAAIMKDGVINASEVRKLLAIHKSGAPPSGEEAWSALLIEAVVDYFATSREVPVYQPEELRPQWGKAMYRMADAFMETFSKKSLEDLPMPLGYSERLSALVVSDEDSNVLIDAISVNGDILNAVEIRLMAALFARAVTYPAHLRAFAWRALSATVAADGEINNDEVSLIRALIMGPASLEGEAVSQSEAQALFAMDKSIGEDKKSDAWPTFFARAVGSYLLYEGATSGKVDQTERMWLEAQQAGHQSKATSALADFLTKWDGQTV